MRKLELSCAAMAAILVTATAAPAAVTVAPDYLYASQYVGETTQSCVASAAGGTFVAVGPGFTAGGQRVVFVSESGATRDVLVGLSSVGDCAYDRANDVLYVTDNGLETGASTGDTVYALPFASAATAVPAAGLEMVPAGSIPNAASVALAPAGVYVGDASGSGAGTVDLVSGGSVVPVVTGLDFTGGIAVEPGGNLLVAQTLASFASDLRRYADDGTLLAVLSGPTFDHGSYDIARLEDGRVAITGVWNGDVVALDPSDGSTSALVSGLTFATGIDADPATGRISILSSSFTGAEEDLTIHRLVPIDRLVAGRGSGKKECLAEVYGVELVPKKPGKKARHAICSDGASCDADGRADGTCTFPVGVCLAVADHRLPDCPAAAIAAIELRKAKPPMPAVETMVASIQASLPVAEGSCFFSDGVAVPVVTTRHGKTKAGKAILKLRVVSAEGKPRKDTDKVKLVCEPAAP